MPCGWLNIPAPKRTTRFPNGSNLAIGSTMEPTQSTAPHRSNTHRLLPSWSSATFVASPIFLPSGKFSQPSSTEYELKVAFCCAKPWPASNANTTAQPSPPQRTEIETSRDIALLRFRTALSRFRAPPRYCNSNTCFEWAVRSEVRLIRLRDRRVLSRVPLNVFGADHFGPWTQVGPIRDGPRPGHGEDAGILDRKVELKHLTAVVGIDLHDTRRGSGGDIGVLFCVAL